MHTLPLPSTTTTCPAWKVAHTFAFSHLPPPCLCLPHLFTCLQAGSTELRPTHPPFLSWDRRVHPSSIPPPTFIHRTFCMVHSAVHLSCLFFILHPAMPCHHQALVPGHSILSCACNYEDDVGLVRVTTCCLQCHHLPPPRRARFFSRLHTGLYSRARTAIPTARSNTFPILPGTVHTAAGVNVRRLRAALCTPCVPVSCLPCSAP